MLVEMYSLQTFAQNLRTELKLPGDPYAEDDDEHKAALAYLKGLNVIYYRDEQSPDGWVIEPDDGGLPLNTRSGYAAYKQLVLLTDDYVPATWQQAFGKRTQKVAVQKHVKRYGDDRVWHRFNEKVLVHGLNHKTVVCIV